jgi:ribosome-associated protein
MRKRVSKAPTLPDESADAPHPKAEDSISKSEMKRRMTALQNVGAQLVELSAERVRKLDLPDDLRSAVLEAQSISAHGGRKRQMQYIGRLMREIDAAPIVAQLERLIAPDRAEVARQHLAERWRTRILEAADIGGEIEAFRNSLPAAVPFDATALLASVARARKEKLQQQPPRGYREVYQMLKAAIDLAPSGAVT